MRIPSPVTPRTQPSTQSLIGTTGGSPTAYAFGAGVAQSLGGFSEAVAGLGDYLRKQDLQAKRFQAERDFADFQVGVQQQLDDLTRNADPAQNNLVDQARAIYQNAEANFLNKKIPPELQSEFSQRTAQMGVGVAETAFKDQQKALDSFYANGLEDASTASNNAVGEEGTTAALDRERAKMDALIEASGLSPAAKIAARRKYYTKLEAIGYKNAVDANLRNPMSAEDVAASLVKSEGDGWKIAGASQEESDAVLQQTMQQASAQAISAIGSTNLWASIPAQAQGVLTALSAQGKLSPDIVQAVHSGDLETLAKAVEKTDPSYAALVRNESGNPSTAIDLDPRYANVPYEDRLALRKDAETEFKAEQTAQTKQDKAQNASLINSLFVALHDGNAGQTDIDQARHDGWLTDINDIVKADDILKKYQGSVGLAAEGFAKLENHQIFSPTDPDDVKRLNAMIGDKGTQAINSMDSQYTANTLVPIVRESRDIPTDVVGLLTGMMRSNDSQKALWALDTMQALQEASPEAYAARVPHDVQGDAELWRATKDYLPQDEILATIRGGETQEQRNVHEMLRTQAKSLITNGKVENPAVALGVGGGFFGLGATGIQPWAGTALASDFNGLFEEAYSKTGGNLQKAQDLAITNLRRVWGVSSVGGSQNLMKYPPEKVGYPTIDNNYSWLDAQARSDLALAPDTQFQLMSDDQTKHEFEAFARGDTVEGPAGQSVPLPGPSYQISTKDASGVYRLLTDAQGAPLRLNFVVTPAMVADQEAKFKQSEAQLSFFTNLQQYSEAQKHSLETGIPIPEDVKSEYQQAHDAAFGFDYSSPFGNMVDATRTE